MKKEIINNLFEFWKEIGVLTNNLIETKNYKSVLDNNSDWPNRVFNSKTNSSTLKSIIDLKNEKKLPQGIAVDGAIQLEKHKEFEFVYHQQNMSLDLKSYEITVIDDKNIQKLNNSLANEFAKVASGSFGYRVSNQTISQIFKSKNIELYLYKETNTFLGCGILFFDSLNNAGLHMIGTLPNGRGKGIGKKITQKLMNEAKKRNMKSCVLHSSKMGKPMYLKLGFQEFGDIKTYRIN